MKRSLKRALALALGLMMLISLMVPQVLAAPESSGKYGKNLKWTYNSSTKTLTLSGKGAMAFYDEDDVPWPSNDIKKVVIKEGVTSLSKYAFWCCESLNSISLPKSLKTVGYNALNGTNLKAVKVAGGSKYFSVKDGVLFNKKKTVLVYYPTAKKGSKYTVPSSVKTIARGAFTGDMDIYSANPNLKTLILPKALKKVEGSAFWFSKISTLKFQGGSPSFGSNALYGMDAKILCPKKEKKSWNSTISALVKEYHQDEGDDFDDDYVDGTSLSFAWY